MVCPQEVFDFITLYQEKHGPMAETGVLSDCHLAPTVRGVEDFRTHIEATELMVRLQTQEHFPTKMDSAGPGESENTLLVCVCVCVAGGLVRRKARQKES